MDKKRNQKTTTQTAKLGVIRNHFIFDFLEIKEIGKKSMFL